jgi:dihydropteroate synthase
MHKFSWSATGRNLLRRDGQCSVMSIVNVTPDSFSDGGTAFAPDLAVRAALQALSDGADIIDIGGESTRPGATPVPLDEEWDRIAPVIAGVLKSCPNTIISVDTYKPEIARRAIAAGALIVNDITGLDPSGNMTEVVAQSSAGVVIMHMQGTPSTMQIKPEYEDVVGEVISFFHRRIQTAVQAGIAKERIAVDPGIGFGKTLEHNLTILRNLNKFAELGCALLIGTSRKRMIGDITGRPVGERTAGSVASALHAAWHGAQVVRVHDTAATVDAIRVWNALETTTGDVRHNHG